MSAGTVVEEEGGGRDMLGDEVRITESTVEGAKMGGSGVQVGEGTRKTVL